MAPRPSKQRALTFWFSHVIRIKRRRRKRRTFRGLSPTPRHLPRSSHSPFGPRPKQTSRGLHQTQELFMTPNRRYRRPSDAQKNTENRLLLIPLLEPTYSPLTGGSDDGIEMPGWNTTTLFWLGTGDAANKKNTFSGHYGNAKLSLNTHQLDVALCDTMDYCYSFWFLVLQCRFGRGDPDCMRSRTPIVRRMFNGTDSEPNLTNDLIMARLEP
jgi:hypothetical protein